MDRGVRKMEEDLMSCEELVDLFVYEGYGTLPPLPGEKTVIVAVVKTFMQITSRSHPMIKVAVLLYEQEKLDDYLTIKDFIYHSNNYTITVRDPQNDNILVGAVTFVLRDYDCYEEVDDDEDLANRSIAEIYYIAFNTAYKKNKKFQDELMALMDIYLYDENTHDIVARADKGSDKAKLLESLGFKAGKEEKEMYEMYAKSHGGKKIYGKKRAIASFEQAGYMVAVTKPSVEYAYRNLDAEIYAMSRKSSRQQIKIRLLINRLIHNKHIMYFRNSIEDREMQELAKKLFRPPKYTPYKLLSKFLSELQDLFNNVYEEFEELDPLYIAAYNANTVVLEKFSKVYEEFPDLEPELPEIESCNKWRFNRSVEYVPYLYNSAF